MTNTFDKKENVAFKHLALGRDGARRQGDRRRARAVRRLGRASTDIVVSHHWENGLNYLLYDALYGNYPLVHNSPFLRDVGYYYPDFEIFDAARAIATAAQTHDARLDDYAAAARRACRSTRSPSTTSTRIPRRSGSCSTAAHSADLLRTRPPMNQTVRNFVVIDSIHGPFVINRHCALQAEALIKTGRPHIQGETDTILHVIDQLPDDAIAVDGGANAKPCACRSRTGCGRAAAACMRSSRNARCSMRSAAPSRSTSSTTSIC